MALFFCSVLLGKCLKMCGYAWGFSCRYGPWSRPLSTKMVLPAVPHVPLGALMLWCTHSLPRAEEHQSKRNSVKFHPDQCVGFQAIWPNAMKLSEVKVHSNAPSILWVFYGVKLSQLWKGKLIISYCTEVTEDILQWLYCSVTLNEQHILWSLCVSWAPTVGIAKG